MEINPSLTLSKESVFYVNTIYIMEKNEKQIITNLMYDIVRSMHLPNSLNEALVSEEVLEAMFIEAKNPLILNESIDTNELSDQLYEDYINGNLNEGFIKKLIGGAIGGVVGLTLGKSIGEAICKILGIGNGCLKTLLTSRIVATALGLAIGKQFGE